MEPLSSEPIEAIIQKLSKKSAFESLEKPTRKHPTQNTTSGNRVQFG